MLRATMRRFWRATLSCALSLIPAAAQQTCAAPPSGMIAWWPLDESTGSSAADIVGNNTARYSGAPSAAAGEVAGSLQFHGGSDYLAAADSDLWAFGAGDFTVELWANFDVVPGGDLVRAGAVFIGNDEGGGAQNKWFFALGGGFLHFSIYNRASPPPNPYIARAPFKPVVGQWYHLAATKAGTLFTTYVNATPSGSERSPSPIGNANAPLTIGQAEGLGFLRGRLDEISIYKRALSAAELKSIFDAGRAGKCKSPDSTTSPSKEPSIYTGGIVNATGDVSARTASPGSLIAIFGSNLAATVEAAGIDATGHIPVSLAGTSVRIGSRDAPLLYASPGQINAAVPYELTPGVYPVTVTTVDGTSSPQNLTVTATSPAIFARAIVKHRDNSVVAETNPVMPGEILVIYCTGLGAVDPPIATGQVAGLNPISSTVAVPSVAIGGVPAQVLHSVLSPGFVGLYQIGIVLPPTLPRGLQPLTITTGGAVSPSFQISSAPWVTMSSIWSRQFDNGITANFLPGGAGARGNSGRYILMAARSDGMIHAGARLQIPAGISPSAVTVRLALTGADGTLTPVGTGALDQGVATLTAPVDPSIPATEVPEYEVVAFEDSNHNGSIDAGEPVVRSRPDRFKVITQARYDLAYTLLLDGANTAGLAYPFARSFLNSFLLGDTPADARATTSTVSIKELSHSVGAVFTTGGADASGSIRKYEFPSRSALSRAVMASDEFTQAVRNTVASACSAGTIAASMKISGTLRFSGDLGLAFGTATINADVKVSGTQARVTGSLYDLYDWDFQGAATAGFFGQLLDPMGASLQAGAFTLGGRGDVFRVEVQFDDVVTVPACQFTCANLAGSWNVQEAGTLTLTVSALGETETESERISGQGAVTIRQAGCAFEYDPIPVAGLTPSQLTPDQIASMKRTGTATGNTVSVKGILAVLNTVAGAVPGITITNVTENSVQASGTVSGNTMTLNSTGRLALTGTFSDSGVSGTFTLTGDESSTSTFRRTSAGQSVSAPLDTMGWRTATVEDGTPAPIAGRLLQAFRRAIHASSGSLQISSP